MKLFHNGIFIFANVLNLVQTNNHLLKISLESFSKFMQNSSRWMGNFAVKDSNPQNTNEQISFENFTPIAELIYKEGLMRVQQQRSYNLHVV